MKVVLRKARITPHTKIKCRSCKKPIEIGQEYWSSHINGWHKDCPEPALQGREKEIIYVLD